MNKKMIGILIATISMILAGCSSFPQHYQPEKTDAKLQTPENTAPQPTAGYMAKESPRAEGQPEGATAVESALAWAEKYSHANVKIEQLQQENANQLKKNNELTQQQTLMQAELAQTQKELREANQMLIEMRSEVDKWKVDVLGFRREMRQEQQITRDSLAKILKLMGSEPVAPVAAATSQESSTAGKPLNKQGPK